MDSGITTSDGYRFTDQEKVTFVGDFDAINAFVNAGCPAPSNQADGFAESYPNGCPILPESND